MDTDTVAAPAEVTQQVDAGDHDKFAHYVHKDHLMISTVDGYAIQALCGKIWMPTRDGRNFPICPECKQIKEGLPI